MDDYANFLIWVGESYYPSIEDFLKESEDLGVSRRIPKFLQGMFVGKTRIYLAHQQKHTFLNEKVPQLKGLKDWEISRILTYGRKLYRGEMKEDEVSEKYMPYVRMVEDYVEKENEQRVVFAFFILDKMEFLSKSEETKEAIQKLIDEGIVEKITVFGQMSEKRRKCGYRNPGSYVSSKEIVDPAGLSEKDIDLGKINVRGPLVVFNEYVPTETIIPGRKPCRAVTKLTEEESVSLAAYVALSGIKEAVNG